LVRNEADKYLERVLTHCLSFSDSVLVLDDGSTDGSDRIAWRLGCQVRPWTGATMWGAESPARAELWDWAAREAGDGWVLIADADMLLHGDPRPLMLTTQHTAWAWPLFDMWSETEYRHDSYWKGHTVARPWMFRPKSLRSEPAIWPDRGIHCGHAPSNFPYNTGILDSPWYYWIHLGYASPGLRALKHRQYLEKANLLSDFERAHADSIID
jgi:glycosyltransferase involved in cell wall biosynthesis